MPTKTTPTVTLAIAILHARGYRYGGITELRLGRLQCYDWGGEYRIDETEDGRPKIVTRPGWRDLELMNDEGDLIHVQVGARSMLASKIADVESYHSARILKNKPGHTVLVIGLETKPRACGTYHYRQATWNRETHHWDIEVLTYTHPSRQAQLLAG